MGTRVDASYMGADPAAIDLIQDWHIHTHRSKCGSPENTVAAIAQALDEGGIQLAGLSDHIDTLEQRHWFEGVLEGNQEDLLAVESDCTIMAGCEATMFSPTRCALEADLAERLDFVLVSCNHYHLKGLVENPEPATPEAYAAHYLDMVDGAIQLGFADIIPHPFMHNKCGPKTAVETLQCYDEGRLAEVLKAAARAGTAFEINPYMVPAAIEWFRDLVHEARRHGTKFTLGSDSHALENIGYRGQANGMTPTDVCHALGLTNGDLKWQPTRATRPIFQCSDS